MTWGVPDDTGVSIRAVADDDEPRLREVAAAAKAHWGYDRGRVEEWARSLDLTPETLAARDVFVAEAAGRPIAFASLVPRGSVCVLDDLWVDPPWIGRGVGRMLFRTAAERAAELGAESMEWEAEPNAHGFYEKMGGRHVGERVSAWGRVNRIMAVPLRARSRP